MERFVIVWEEPSPAGVPRVPHEPVLLSDVVRWLSPCLAGPGPDAWVVDATVGLGGHAEALLDLSPRVRLLGLDRDPEAIEWAQRRLARFGDRVRIRQANFRDLGAVLGEEGVDGASAILLDLGVSSLQLDDPARGFSFRSEGPLDMRMGPDAPRSAGDVLRLLTEHELEEIISDYGEDRYARRIAKGIAMRLARGELRSTVELARVIAGSVPPSRPVRGSRSAPIHPATRAFQAIRIAVNGELEALEAALPQALGALRPGGRMAAIAFHSLEDRRVKQFLAREARDCVCPPELPVCRCGHVKTVSILTRKPVEPSEDEVRDNPRARSAKLRVAERL
ncbi:MAG: 16S rRNA (cytosine(1402)-N(4))-methyltransferase RsmH [Candidatus Coatesbacteria bacterium]|mgnify:CR=1 FL=1